MSCILKYVIVFQLLYRYARGRAYLVMLTKPVVFGESVQLACMANETEIPLDKPHSRSWSGGPYNALLCMNGVSADSSKYNEEKGKEKNQYNLKIRNFSVMDVNCEYKCVFGVDITRLTLHLNQKDYEYLPSRESTTVVSSLRHGHFSVTITFVKVWPIPVCEIIFERLNFAKRIRVSKTKNGKLFSANMSLEHVFKSDVCSGDMLISCRIGTKNIEVGRKQFHTCPETVKNKGGNLLNDKMLITMIVAIFMFVFMVFVIVLYLVIKQKGYTTINNTTVHVPENPNNTDDRIHLTNREKCQYTKCIIIKQEFRC
ncbi:uncharacterized protein [Mytilus edulis]|uniref:uncharacterized protein isoform X1 n=2 Tax=Mytilus edulis TaxID=6550 RepID=UPI0039F14985